MFVRMMQKEKKEKKLLFQYFKKQNKAPDNSNLYAGQEATISTRHRAMDWFKIGKGYVKAVYCHPVYLTYMQSTSCEMLGWVTHRLESRLLGEISTTSDMQMIPL